MRAIQDVKPQIVTVGDLRRGLDGVGLPLLPDVDPWKCQGGAARGDVDQVGHNGRGGRHLPGSGSGIPRFADGVPFQRDHIERPAALGQRPIVMHERWLHVHFQLPVDKFGDRQKFDRVTQLVGILEVGQFQGIDPLPRERARADFRPECQAGENRQLLGGVGSVQSMVGSASA